MQEKDRIEALLAFLVVGTFCYLVGIGKIDAGAIVAIASYIVKKFMDGIHNNKGEGK